MKLVFNPASGNLDWVSSVPADVGLAGLATNITASKTLTLTAADNYTLTIPATGTAALLGTANVFTTQQMVDGTSNQTQLRVQAHSTQTANIGAFENSSGTVLAGVDGTGRLFSYGAAAITSNTFIGASGNGTLTGGECVVIGALAGANLTSGNQNFLFGSSAGRILTSGGNNVALGHAAMYTSQTGNNNICIGALSGGYVGNGGIDPDNNVCIGVEAGYKLTGDFNTFIGYGAGRQTTGSSNLFLGHYAGFWQAAVSNLLILNNNLAADAATEVKNAIVYGVMATAPASQTLRLNATTSIVQETAATNTVVNVAIIQAESTGTAAAGLGAGLLYSLETATAGTMQTAGLISASWVEATNATRKAKLSLSAYDTAARLGLEIEASGTEPKIGFYGVAPIARAVLATGAGASVDDVITALQNLGLVKQS